MALRLPPLPYPLDGLEPHLSARAVEVHYRKHHGGYVSRVNELLAHRNIEVASLEDLVRGAWKSGDTALFNAASQAWNHQFFWASLSPHGEHLTPDLAALVERDFGSLDDLKHSLREAALSQFGSGWVWLVWQDGRLQVTRTANADSPLTHGQIPLLTIDVWEHAYYLDYQSERQTYVQALLANLVDWGAAGARWRTIVEAEQ